MPSFQLLELDKEFLVKTDENTFWVVKQDSVGKWHEIEKKVVVARPLETQQNIWLPNSP